MRLDGDEEAAADDEDVEAEQGEHAEQSELLAHDGENEIGVAFRQVFELRLRALPNRPPEPIAILDWMML